jgi:hypothetical protein
MRRALRRAGFSTERMRAASLFRLPALTRRLPPRKLARLEGLLQEPLGSITPGPSVFVLARRQDRASRPKGPLAGE